MRSGGNNFFEFDVVSINDMGQEISRNQSRAEFFTEDLGNNVSLEMVSIPSGQFWMGASRLDIPQPQYFQAIYQPQKPRHQVTIPAFYMGKFPITQAQWARVAILPKVNIDLKFNPSQFQGGERPVECVSWEDTIEFCTRLSRETGKSYRLPTEAEWEYACRAGTITPFHFGKTITTYLANYDGNFTYGSERQGLYLRQTTFVGSYEIANSFGLYDMHGLVFEWCQDIWHKNYIGAPTDGTAWIDETVQYWFRFGSFQLSCPKYRVLRGGSCYFGPHHCSSAFRRAAVQHRKLNHIGFRVVVSSE
ncbi:formylglycine-generating enzyme family protein [uncultured Nostoc sp.]|uniref:formylglycine-generating enzyme family protein n=1 Tax=uncultured Nostoc sp. TaxID=340711 RepID=UPI0035CB4AF4